MWHEHNVRIVGCQMQLSINSKLRQDTSQNMLETSDQVAGSAVFNVLQVVSDSVVSRQTHHNSVLVTGCSAEEGCDTCVTAA